MAAAEEMRLDVVEENKQQRQLIPDDKAAVRLYLIHHNKRQQLHEQGKPGNLHPTKTPAPPQKKSA